MSVITIIGLSPTDKVPGAYGEVITGGGAVSASSIPLKLLAVGMKTSDGSANADADLVPIFQPSDAIAAFGQRSQLTRMLLKILGTGNTVDLTGIAVAEPGGGTAATVAVTFAGSWTVGGTYTFWIGGIRFDVNATSSDTATTFANKCALAIGSVANAPFTAANVAGVLTITAANLGTFGNLYIYYENKSQIPSGMTTAVAGGSTLPMGGTWFSGGVGAENVTNVLAVIFPNKYDRIAIGQVDSTNFGRWRTQVDAQAVALEDKRQQAICATSASSSAQSNATTIASTTLNDARFQTLFLLNTETHPAELAAEFSAMRIGKEAIDPDASYDGAVLTQAAPQRNIADYPTHSQLVAMLNSGVTPLKTTKDQRVACVRSIVTHCLTGSNPDYSVLDTGDITVADYVCLDAQLQWASDFLPANPRVRDNPAPDEPELTQGIAYPDLWTRFITGRLRRFERGDDFPAPILINVSANLPVSTWEPVGHKIMCAIATVAAYTQHQIGNSVRQKSA